MRSLALAVLLSPTVAGAIPAPAAVEITLVPRAGLEAGTPVAVALSNATGEGATSELRTGAPVVSLPLPGEGPWQLRCVSAQAWCPVVEIEDRPDEPFVIPVYEKTRLRGLLEPAAGRRAPEAVTVHGWVDVKRHGSLSAPDAVFVERVAVEKGRFALDVPMAPLDLRIAVPGAAPVYRWRASVESGTLDLGVIALHPGASISGFVTTAEGGPLSETTVEVAPLGDAATAETEAAIERTRQRAVTDRSGFFQIADLTPGRYRLSARGRDDLSVVIEPIELAPDEEVHLRSVRLSPPLALSVLLTPPRPPASTEGWTVRISSATGPNADQKVASLEGEATFRPLSPGRYDIIVQSAAGDTVAQSTVEVDSDLTLPIALEIVEVEGRVRLGGDPLVAQVQLETGNLDRRTFETDAEGRFGGWLRMPDWDWLLVEISSPLLPGERRLELAGSEVEVEDGVLGLDLYLQDGRVEGTLVDRLGRLVAGVEVTAWRKRDPDARTRTDAKGRFSLGGLEYDSYWITAGNPGIGAIQPVRVELTESAEHQELWLALLPIEEITGTLTTAEGGALAAADIAVDSLGMGFGTSTSTDAAGAFRARVLAGTSQVAVVVLAPSHGLWAGCLPIDEERRLAITLPPGAPGALELVFEWDEDLPPAPGDLGLVSESGGRIAAGVLEYWRSKAGPTGETGAAGSQVVPAVVPGAWALGWNDEPGWLALQTACSNVPGADYEWTVVPPGGIAEIRYDIEPHQRDRVNRARTRSGDLP